MAKTKKPPKPRDAYPKLPAPSAAAPSSRAYAVRETVESIVIAFVLAFLFRTFEAEAFVIPTGSMAPTLMGRHKDVDCPKCGYRYQVSASEEESEDPRARVADCVAGMCPICHYVLPMRPDLPPDVPESRRKRDIDFQRSYNGDRILVNKYIYTLSDPRRWDVVVFKFPGNAPINYIKRLVGLPGETLRVYQGDLFVGGKGASQDADFKIAAKPADKVLAMRQLVHDTEHDPAELDAAGWPLRWHLPAEGEARGWQVEKTADGNTVRQRYGVVPTEGESWMRYEHIVPDYHVWRRLAELEEQSSPDNPPAFSGAERGQWRRRLITDANQYNARQSRPRAGAQGSLEIEAERQGLHWVGDLIVEAEVEVEAAQGELLLDLVEGGQHFRCTIELTSGQATLSAVGVADYGPTAKTSLIGPGNYRVAFANIDDQLLLWVDGDVVQFDGGTAYDVDQVYGDRRDIRPRTSDEDLGDLAPVGVGARNAKLAVTRLQVWRDIYYIADSWHNNLSRYGNVITDFQPRGAQDLVALSYDPRLWDEFAARRHVDFPLGSDQFFVMGDNSAESSDARLWSGETARGGKPGGDYLERRLLIGKALCVYWPHSWHRIPGTPIPFPLFPNIADMRLVR